MRIFRQIYALLSEPGFVGFRDYTDAFQKYRVLGVMLSSSKCEVRNVDCGI